MTRCLIEVSLVLEGVLSTRFKPSQCRNVGILVARGSYWTTVALLQGVSQSTMPLCWNAGGRVGMGCNFLRAAALVAKLSASYPTTVKDGPAMGAFGMTLPQPTSSRIQTMSGHDMHEWLGAHFMLSWRTPAKCDHAMS